MTSTSTSNTFKQVYIPGEVYVCTDPPESPKGPNIFGTPINIDWHHSPSVFKKKRATYRDRKTDPRRAPSWAVFEDIDKNYDEPIEMDDEKLTYEFVIHPITDRSRLHAPLHRFKLAGTSNKDNEPVWKADEIMKRRFASIVAAASLGGSLKKMAEAEKASNATQDFSNMNFGSPAQTISSNGSSPLGRKSSVDPIDSPVRSTTQSSTECFDTPVRPQSEVRMFTPQKRTCKVNLSQNVAFMNGAERIIASGSSLESTNSVITPRAARKRGYLSALGTPIATSTPIVTNQDKKGFAKLSKIDEISSSPILASPTIPFKKFDDSFDDPAYDVDFGVPIESIQASLKEMEAKVSSSIVPDNRETVIETNCENNPPTMEFLPAKETDTPTNSTSVVSPSKLNTAFRDSDFGSDTDFGCPGESVFPPKADTDSPKESPVSPKCVQKSEPKPCPAESKAPTLKPKTRPSKPKRKRAIRAFPQRRRRANGDPYDSFEDDIFFDF